MNHSHFHSLSVFEHFSVLAAFGVERKKIWILLTLKTQLGEKEGTKSVDGAVHGAESESTKGAVPWLLWWMTMAALVLPLRCKSTYFCAESVETQVKSLRKMSLSELKPEEKVLSGSLTFSLTSIICSCTVPSAFVYLFISDFSAFIGLCWRHHIISEAVSFRTQAPTRTPTGAAHFMNVWKTDCQHCRVWGSTPSRVQFGLEMGKTFGPFIILTALSEGHVPLDQDLKPPHSAEAFSLFFRPPSNFIAWCRLSG